MPALVTFEVLKKHLTNVGAPGVPLALTALGTATNLGAGVGLVFFTPLGFLGAPCALVLGAWVMVGAALAYFRFHRALHAAMRAHGLGALVPGSTLAESAAAAASAASAAAAAAAAAASSATATIASEGQTRSLVASASSVGVADLGDVLDEARAAADAASASLTSVAVASVGAPAAASVGAPAVASGPPPLPTDIDDVLDATLADFSLAIALSGWREYLSLGLPSAAMLFFEWASYEVTAVIAGLMSINALATHSILATTASLAFMPILGIGVATMIRIGNRLGERRPDEAKRTFRVAMVVWLVYAALNAVFLLSVAPVWGRVFTDDAGVDAHVTRIIWILALYGVFDLGQCILCFVFRGLGRPGMAALANGTGYVCVGLPLAYVFGITLGGSVLGMWIGYFVAVTFVFVLLGLLMRCIDFSAESEAAFARSTAPDAHKQAAPSH
jgi:Na+-driven multidrug efflux pump